MQLSMKSENPAGVYLTEPNNWQSLLIIAKLFKSVAVCVHFSDDINIFISVSYYETEHPL